MVRFKVSKIEASIQVQGDDVAAMVVVGGHIVCRQMGNVGLVAFRSQFASGELTRVAIV